MMKKIINIFAMVALAAMTLISCDDPDYPQGATDEGQLKMSTLGIDVDATENIVTKAGVDVSNFTVRILEANTNALKNSWTYSQMPEIITLPTGDYVVEVYNADVKEAAFDAPYYYASKNVTISKNQIAELGTVMCTLQNVKVSVEYAPDLKAVMSDDVKVTVEVAQKNVLEYSATETRAGYFRYYDNATTLVASFSGTVDGVFITEHHKIMTDVAPRKHYIITFAFKGTPLAGEEEGSVNAVNFTIDASVTVKNETRNIIIEDEIIEPFDFLTTSLSKLDFLGDASSQKVTVKSSSAWTVKSSDTSWCTISNEGANEFTVNVTENPGATRTADVVVTMGSLSKTIKVTQAEKGGSQPAPSFSSETIDLDNYNDAALFGPELLPALVKISAPNGIKSLFVNINSGTLTQDILQGVGLDTQFDLATGKAPSGNDLTNGLAGLGFPVANGGTTPNGIEYAPVVNETEVDFDITQFIPLLSIYGAANHDFELTVTDNLGQVGKASIKFQTK